MGILRQRHWRRWPGVCLLMVIALGMYWRIHGLATRGMEYDEIWTLEHYGRAGSVATIFAEMSTGNNRFLHSVVVYYGVRLLGESALVGRAIPYLCGALTLLVVAAMTRRLAPRNPFVPLWAVALCAFHGGLIHYGQLSRGYSMQAFWLVLYVYLLVLAETSRIGRRHHLGLWAAANAAAVLAVLTHSTSILFLAPIMTAHGAWSLFNDHGCWNWHPGTMALVRRMGRLLMRHGTAVALVGLWYGVNMGKFQTSITGIIHARTPLALASYMLGTYRHLELWPLILALALGMLLSRRTWFLAGALAMLLLLPFL